MPRKSHISQIKKVKIKSSELLNNTDRGTFFKIRNNNSDRFVPIIRLTTPVELYGELINELEKYPHSATHLLNSIPKTKIAELNSPKLIFLNFDAEFAWAKAILHRNSNAINRYVVLANEFSTNLLNGNLVYAGKILIIIEKEFGYSIWLIKTKIAYLQMFEGLESQKKYTNSINDNLPNGSFPKFITHWISVRNESQTSYSRYENQIESIVNKLDPVKQIGYKEYIRYHLLSKEDLNPENFIQVLRMEYSSSLIDYYESYQSLLRILSINGDEINRHKSINALKNKRNFIEDPRLNFLSILLDVKSFENQQVCSLSSFDKIVELNFDSNEIALNKPFSTQIDYIELISNAYHIAFNQNENEVSGNRHGINEQNFKDNLTNQISHIVKSGTITASEEFNELVKIVLNFSHFSWTSIIQVFLSKENYSLRQFNLECELDALKFPHFHPYFLNCISNQIIAKSYERICTEAFSQKPYLQYAVALKNSDLDLLPVEISSDFQNLLVSHIKFDKNDFNRALFFGEKLANSTNDYFKRRGFGFITHSLLSMGELEMACIQIAEYYLDYKDFYPFLPLAQILEKLRPGTKNWKTVNNLIDLPIILDAYYKLINKNLEVERRFAYEDFLLKNNMKKPSELKDKLGSFSHKKIVYYLRYVCVENTMDTSSEFSEGSAEVVQERLHICRILSNIDPQNEETYKTEINEIVKRQVITSRRQEVDQSRIYVDISNIREWSESELKESFSRYTAYLRNNLKFTSETKIQKSKPGDVLMDIPSNEVNSLLKYMIQEITDAYLSPDFGLDRFISTRIRHGILEGHLRRPLQNHNLITSREFKNGPYLRNDFWLDKLDSRPLSTSLNSAFSKFSELYDNLITQIIGWLQINKKNSLFQFGVSDEELSTISSKITQETTLKEFIDLIINVLESTLIVQLMSIREKLNIEAKSKAKKLLNELQESTDVAANPISAELHGAIYQARTELQVQFDKIIEWFVTSSSGNSTPYFIEDAMMVAEAIIKETNPIFKINLENSNDETFSIHGQLPIFVDIFVNIFENVVKRSGLEVPEANIKIKVIYFESNLVTINLDISNNLGLQINQDSLNIEMSRKMKLLEEGSYSQYLATEGNSGLFKIHKSVKDFKVSGSSIKPSIMFGVSEDMFQISISIPFLLYSLESDDV